MADKMREALEDLANNGLGVELLPRKAQRTGDAGWVENEAWWQEYLRLADANVREKAKEGLGLRPRPRNRSELRVRLYQMDAFTTRVTVEAHIEGERVEFYHDSPSRHPIALSMAIFRCIERLSKEGAL